VAATFNPYLLIIVMSSSVENDMEDDWMVQEPEEIAPTYTIPRSVRVDYGLVEEYTTEGSNMGQASESVGDCRRRVIGMIHNCTPLVLDQGF
jgi:hypothetical protein